MAITCVKLWPSPEKSDVDVDNANDRTIDLTCDNERKRIGDLYSVRVFFESLKSGQMHACMRMRFLYDEYSCDNL